jgi:hypothetical protein
MRVDLNIVQDVWDCFLEKAQTQGARVFRPEEVQQRFERRQRERIVSGAAKGWKNSLHLSPAPQETPTEAFSWPLTRRRQSDKSSDSNTPDSNTPWVELYDESVPDQPYFWNTITQETTWTLPSGTVAVQANSTEAIYGEQQVTSSSIRITDGIRSLRAGVVRNRQGDSNGERWVELWDSSSEQSYYFREITGQLQWEEPQGSIIELETPLKAPVRTPVCKELRPIENNRSEGRFVSLLPSPGCANREYDHDDGNDTRGEEGSTRGEEGSPWRGRMAADIQQRYHDGSPWRGRISARQVHRQEKSSQGKQGKPTPSHGRSPAKLCYPAGFIEQAAAEAEAAAAVSAAAEVEAQGLGEGGGFREAYQQDGSIQDGSIQDGSIQDGSIQDGSIQDGSIQDGKEEREGGGAAGEEGRAAGEEGRAAGEVGYFDAGGGESMHGYYDGTSGEFVHGYTDAETNEFVHGYTDAETNEFVHGFFDEEGGWVAGYYDEGGVWASTAEDVGGEVPRIEYARLDEYGSGGVDDVGGYDAAGDGADDGAGDGAGGDGSGRGQDGAIGSEWTEYWDEGAALPYWYNHTTGESTFEDPSATDAAGVNTSVNSHTSEWSEDWDGDSAVVIATTPAQGGSSTDWVEIWDENQPLKQGDGACHSARQPLWEDMD